MKLEAALSSLTDGVVEAATSSSLNPKRLYVMLGSAEVL
jgi:hypothetical protein